MTWLQDHHARAHVHMRAHTKTGIASHIQRDEKPASLRKQAVGGGPIVTRMSSLASQYVGPLSVGTVTSPAGCNDGSTGASLIYLPRGAGGDSQTADTCHMEEQSHIWAVFDTGSTNLWVASDLCSTGPCTKKGRRRYNHTLSQTYAAPREADHLKVTFGTGSLS